MNLKNLFALLTLIAALSCGVSENAFAQEKQSAPKFNAELETDFQKGLGGDEAALARAVKAADEILAINPKNAETLVWRGVAGLSQAGKAFQSGNFAEGGELWQKALDNMKSAIEVAPDNVSIRMIRAAALSTAAKQFPAPEVVRNLRETVIADYEKVLTLTSENFKATPEKQRQQILSGLADAYDKLGDKTKARVFYRRLVEETSEAGKTRETALEWLKANN